ncbi:hypothetical protein PTKIN_Ptkin01aG0138200 [Pterospermum kingtungense]
MIFSSARICFSIHVVLCYHSLFWKLLSQRSKGEIWTCCLCNSCTDMYNCSDNHNT